MHKSGATKKSVGMVYNIVLLAQYKNCTRSVAAPHEPSFYYPPEWSHEICTFCLRDYNFFSLLYTGCNRWDIRLAEGRNPLEGRVEICLNDVWATVCNQYWDNTDARVVCRQIGFSTAGNL